MKQKLFFLTSLPRAGNTLLSSILNQNPDIASTANSIILDIFKNLNQSKSNDIYKNFPDEKSFDNVIQGIIPNYYKDWPQKYIIERSPIGNPGNYDFIKKYFDQPLKCIVLVRDLLDILASFMKWWNNNPNALINRQASTDEDKLKMMFNNETGFVAQLESVRFLMELQNKNVTCFVKYDDLITDPQSQIQKIYNFLEIPKFEHNYNSISQLKLNGYSYDDSYIGDNLHTIRTDGIYKEDNPYRSLIPPYIVKKYGHIKF